MTDSIKYTGIQGLAPLGWFILLVLAAWIFPQTPASGFIFCPFRWLLELSCPGCGMTRSVTSFVRGDWTASLAYHPAGPLLLIALGIAASLRISDRLLQRPVLAGPRGLLKRFATPLWATALGLLLVFWGIRLYGELFGAV